VSPPVRRLTSRDYKNTRRQRLDVARMRDFGAGLALGLVIAGVAFLYGRSLMLPATVRPEPQRPVPQKVAPADADEPATRQYDFYEMLPKFEVVVPEKDREVRRDLPAAKVERPGVYVLQAGSYRNFADADRIRAQLARQGIDARVQRVAVDADVWHRVRIGPINDLAELNRLRSQLRAADLDALVIRVGD
jgi:cell division protein FtsN